MQSSPAGESPENQVAPGDEAPRLPRGICGRWPALTYVLPFAVYMLVTAGIESYLEKPEAARQQATDQEGAPTDHPGEEDADDLDQASDLPPADGHVDNAHDDAGHDPHDVAIPYKHYPTIYTAKIALTMVAMLLVIRGYLAFPLKVNGVALVVGLIGVVVWVGLCKLNLEQKVLVPLGLGGLVDMGERPGFNPLEQLKDDPAWAYGFLAIRLFGMVIIIPIIEEFFIRGFLMRFVMDVDWFKIPFGKVDRLALIAGTAFPALMHPAELFAAIAWFSLVTWLMLRTRNIWDCVAAHAVTNALLAAYVLATGEWQLM